MTFRTGIAAQPPSGAGLPLAGQGASVVTWATCYFTTLAPFQQGPIYRS